MICIGNKKLSDLFNPIYVRIKQNDHNALHGAEDLKSIPVYRVYIGDKLVYPSSKMFETPYKLVVRYSSSEEWRIPNPKYKEEEVEEEDDEGNVTVTVVNNGEPEDIPVKQIRTYRTLTIESTYPLYVKEATDYREALWKDQNGPDTDISWGNLDAYTTMDKYLIVSLPCLQKNIPPLAYGLWPIDKPTNAEIHAWENVNTATESDKVFIHDDSSVETIDIHYDDEGNETGTDYNTEYINDMYVHSPTTSNGTIRTSGYDNYYTYPTGTKLKTDKDGYLISEDGKIKIGGQLWAEETYERDATRTLEEGETVWWSTNFLLEFTNLSSEEEALVTIEGSPTLRLEPDETTIIAPVENDVERMEGGRYRTVLSHTLVITVRKGSVKLTRITKSFTADDGQGHHNADAEYHKPKFSADENIIKRYGVADRWIPLFGPGVPHDAHPGRELPKENGGYMGIDYVPSQISTTFGDGNIWGEYATNYPTGREKIRMRKYIGYEFGNSDCFFEYPILALMHQDYSNYVDEHSRLPFPDFMFCLAECKRGYDNIAFHEIYDGTWTSVPKTMSRNNPSKSCSKNYTIISNNNPSYDNPTEWIKDLYKENPKPPV